MRFAPSLVAVLVAGIALVAGCGGATTSLGPGPGPGPGGGDDGGTPPVVPGTPGTPDQHRPQALACTPNPGTGVACTTDAECASVTPNAVPDHCFHGSCSPDQCTSDSDCASGTLCSCAGATRGYAGQSPGNVCIPADCRVDSDCGPGGYCSPTVSSGCGSFYGVQGYYCHRAGDACMNDEDCGGDGGMGTPYCAFDPSVGQWACGNSFCAG
jgi:hypothetical protein